MYVTENEDDKYMREGYLSMLVNEDRLNVVLIYRCDVLWNMGGLSEKYVFLVEFVNLVREMGLIYINLVEYKVMGNLIS